MENEERRMESMITTQRNDRSSNNDVAFDILADLFDLFGVEITEDEIKMCVRDYISGERKLKKILSDFDIHTLISSEDLIEHQGAVNNIARFILDNVADVDKGNRDAVMELYTVFAQVFEQMSHLFNGTIKDHRHAGGEKIGSLISLTYITLIVLYKGNFIRRRISIAKTSRIFNRTSSSIKRLLYRLRRENGDAMTYIEENSDLESSVSINEVIRNIKEMIDDE